MSTTVIALPVHTHTKQKTTTKFATATSTKQEEEEEEGNHTSASILFLPSLCNPFQIKNQKTPTIALLCIVLLSSIMQTNITYKTACPNDGDLAVNERNQMPTLAKQHASINEQVVPRCHQFARDEQLPYCVLASDEKKGRLGDPVPNIKEYMICGLKSDEGIQSIQNMIQTCTINENHDSVGETKIMKLALDYLDHTDLNVMGRAAAIIGYLSRLGTNLRKEDSATVPLEKLNRILQDMGSSVPHDVIGSLLWAVEALLPSSSECTLGNQRLLKETASAVVKQIPCDHIPTSFYALTILTNISDGNKELKAYVNNEMGNHDNLLYLLLAANEQDTHEAAFRLVTNLLGDSLAEIADLVVDTNWGNDSIFVEKFTGYLIEEKKTDIFVTKVLKFTTNAKKAFGDVAVVKDIWKTTLGYLDSTDLNVRAQAASSNLSLLGASFSTEDSRTMSLENLNRILQGMDSSVPHDVIGSLLWAVEALLPSSSECTLGNQRLLKETASAVGHVWQKCIDNEDISKLAKSMLTNISDVNEELKAYVKNEDDQRRQYARENAELLIQKINNTLKDKANSAVDTVVDSTTAAVDKLNATGTELHANASENIQHATDTIPNR